MPVLTCILRLISFDHELLKCIFQVNIIDILMKEYRKRSGHWQILKFGDRIAFSLVDVRAHFRFPANTSDPKSTFGRWDLKANALQLSYVFLPLREGFVVFQVGFPSQSNSRSCAYSALDFDSDDCLSVRLFFKTYLLPQFSSDSFQISYRYQV